MSNTHQRISDNAMMEWSFLTGKITQDNILLKETSPLCMLPSPLNLLTTALSPLHYVLMKQGVSLCGSVADKILIIPGNILSYCLLLSLNMQRILSRTRQVFMETEKVYMLPLRLFFIITSPFWLLLLVIFEGFLALFRHPLLHIDSDGI